MKVTVTTTAAEVVEFVTTTKSLPQRNYALFLVLGDAESGNQLVINYIFNIYNVNV